MFAYFTSNAPHFDLPLRILRRDFHVFRRYQTVPTYKFFWWKGYLQSVIKAIPYPKTTELSCRLPSLTVFYWSEAVYLGDLMRMWVRTTQKWKENSIFSKYRKFTISLENQRSLSHQLTSLHKKCFQELQVSTENDISSPGFSIAS